MEHHDVVIVGAGIWGLSAARTFLTIEPSMSLLVIESKQSLGGVWATEQIYPGLRTNSIEGFFEFSDFPVLGSGVDVKPRSHMSGQAFHDYLEKFTDNYNIRQHIRFSTKVLRAVEDSTGSGWTLETMGTNEATDGSTTRISCTKLVLATGQLNTAYRPTFAKMPLFKRPIVHTVELGKRALELLVDDEIQTVAVVGGAKSAHDAVYMLASAGKRVNWIVHSASHGRGPVPMGKAWSQLGPWTIFVEATLMFRPLTWFCPAPWSDGDGFGWIRWLLHGTSLGNKLVKGYWQNAGEQGPRESGILNDEKSKVLLPTEMAMWYGTTLSSLNYDTDFYENVRNDKVVITKGDIKALSDGKVLMGDGTILNADAMVLATGYDYSVSVPLEPASQRLGWGCPVDPSEDTVYPEFDDKADKELFLRFPILRESPSKPERLPSLTPWRLWRYLAPPSQVRNGSRRNLVFLNAIACFQTCIRSDVTSLWAYAYLNDRLSTHTPSTEAEIQQEVSLWTRFGKWRGPLGMQGKQADFLTDAMPYYDLLLRDLGIRSWRKGWSWFGEIFFGQAYKAKDYNGIIQEWIATQGERSIGDRKSQ